MTSLELQKEYGLIDIIDFYLYQENLSHKVIIFDFLDIFTTEKLREVDENTKCYLDEPIDDDLLDEDKNPEGYSEFVLEHKLNKFCSGEVLGSVIYNTLHQKEKATTKDIIQNLNFYIKNDIFMKL